MSNIQEILLNVFNYPKLKLEDVFTPAKAAGINYIERGDIDELLSSEISTPGKQIIVFGHSGSGKTSSVLNLLRKNNYKYIKTHCESKTTFEQLLLNAFDALNIFVISGRTYKKTVSLKGNIAVEYKSIKSSIESVKTNEDSQTYTRLLPPQLTPQKLAQFLGEGNIVWLIEDFHKVSPEEKIRIADVIKIFVDNANHYSTSKIICIGACQSAYDMIQLNPNLRTRISEVSVPLLSDKEINKIITNGFKLLNIVPSDTLVEKLVYYSDRLGAFAHQMCMDICKKENITQRCRKKRRLNDDAFQHAVNAFIQRSSDTFKSLYEAAIKNELGWYILRTFAGNVKDKLSLDEIYKRVNNIQNRYKNKQSERYSKEEIRNKLEELMSPRFSIVYYNDNSGKYALSTPFWHRFLRLQMNIERSEKQNKNRNKNNPHLKLIDNDKKYSIVDESMLVYIMELNKEIRNELSTDLLSSLLMNKRE